MTPEELWANNIIREAALRRTRSSDPKAVKPKLGDLTWAQRELKNALFLFQHEPAVADAIRYGLVCIERKQVVQDPESGYDHTYPAKYIIDYSGGTP